MKKKVAIIGAGAAGVFCAIKLGENPNLEIHIYEKGNEPLKKLRISGGGRCNATHRYISNAQFSKNYPRGGKILKSNFEIFSPQDMYQWLEDRGVQLKTEEDGRIFPKSDSSQTIINCFEKELARFHIPIHFSSEIQRIIPKKKGFELYINQKLEEFDFVIVATGGAAKERDLEIYKSIDIKTISPVPSLFTFKINEKSLTELMGLSIPNVQIRIKQSNFKEIGIVLITHWGLSGPAILKLSAWGAFFLAESNYHFQISINWAGEQNEAKVLQEIEALAEKHKQGKISNYKMEKFPNRFWDYLLLKSEIDGSKKWSEISKKSINKLSQSITNSSYDIQGKTTFKDEFVTAGGIDTEYLNTRSMESKTIQNLYFIGEITNMDGITGGFNFQNAWTSAIVAAENINKKASSKN